MNLREIVILLCTVFALNCIECARVEYIIETVSLKSSSDSLFNGSLRVHRIERGVYGFSGSGELKKDLDASTTVEIQTWRSLFGNNQFTLTAYNIPRTPIVMLMNTVYQRLVANILRKCSNFPQFKGIWLPPFPKNHYWMKNCREDKNGSFPTIVQPGYYKLIILIKMGSENITWEIVSKTQELPKNN